MSENFVRKTQNVKNIKAKETYTLHDLDMVETEDGHVYIRIKRKNTEFNNEGDRFAYFYELTNCIRNVNGISLGNNYNDNIGKVNMPLVMDVQHLDGELQVTMSGSVGDIYKVNGIAGTFNNGVTTYTIPLEDTIPDITIKQGNAILAVYEIFQADLNQVDQTHPEYVKGAKLLLQKVNNNETAISDLSTRVHNLETKPSGGYSYLTVKFQISGSTAKHLGVLTNDVNADGCKYTVQTQEEPFGTVNELQMVETVHTLPNGFKLIDLGDTLNNAFAIWLFGATTSEPKWFVDTHTQLFLGTINLA